MNILAWFFSQPKRQPGIYRIRNRMIDCDYIGMSTRPMIERWNEHRYDLKQGIHKNKRLQSDWDKYGSHWFRFSVVEIVLDTSLVFEREKYWISHTYAQQDVYNIRPSLPPEMTNRVAVLKLLAASGWTVAEAQLYVKGTPDDIMNDMVRAHAELMVEGVEPRPRLAVRT